MLGFGVGLEVELEEGMATAAGWQPQEEGLKEICDLLEQYRLPTVDQSRIWQQHQRCSQLPDFNNYLAFILCRAEVRLNLISHPSIHQLRRNPDHDDDHHADVNWNRVLLLECG